ncbi:unnamed protein product [Amaranthus hypochondriacus]
MDNSAVPKTDSPKKRANQSEDYVDSPTKKTRSETSSSSTPTLIIEHGTDDIIFSMMAWELQAYLKFAEVDIKVLVNPMEEPRNASFVVSLEGGEEFLKYLYQEPPYELLRACDLEGVVERIRRSINQ